MASLALKHRDLFDESLPSFLILTVINVNTLIAPLLGPTLTRGLWLLAGSLVCLLTVVWSLQELPPYLCKLDVTFQRGEHHIQHDNHHQANTTHTAAACDSDSFLSVQSVIARGETTNASLFSGTFLMRFPTHLST